MEEKDLKYFINLLKGISEETGLDISEDKLFEQACTYHRQSLIGSEKRGGKNLPKSTHSIPPSEPATEKQLYVIRKSGIMIPKNLTKLEASKMVEKIKQNEKK